MYPFTLIECGHYLKCAVPLCRLCVPLSVVRWLFLTYETVSFIFGGAGKFCLANWLRQLTRDIECDVNGLEMRLTRRNEKLRMTFGVLTVYFVSGNPLSNISVSFMFDWVNYAL